MNNNAPKIRFKGFTDAWVQRKLGEVANVIGGGTPSTGNDKYWNGDIDWYTPAEIGEQIYLENSQRKITEIGLKDSSARMLPVGTVLFTSRAGIGNTAILTKTSTTNQGFQSIVPHKYELDTYFIFSRTPELKKYGETVGAGSTFVEVSGKQMAQMPMLIPSLPEQTAIGTFFRTLDDTITLHKRKLDGLKKLKSGYLQVMFPQNGESVPKVRFKGFEGAWQERKLGEMLTERNEQFEESDEYPLMSFVGNVGVIPKGEQYDRSFLVKRDDKRYKRTELNDFIYSSNNLETGSIGFNRTGKAVISPVYSIFYSNSDSESLFVGLLSKRKDFINKMIHYRQGVMYGQWRIHERDFLKILVLTPTAAEQNMIIEFFRNLDEQITTQTQKLEQLKQLKAAFLQKMFV